MLLNVKRARVMLNVKIKAMDIVVVVFSLIWVQESVVNEQVPIYVIFLFIPIILFLYYDLNRKLCSRW